jgi:hypothetical protein
MKEAMGKEASGGFKVEVLDLGQIDAVSMSHFSTFGSLIMVVSVHSHVKRELKIGGEQCKFRL